MHSVSRRQLGLLSGNVAAAWSIAPRAWGQARNVMRFVPHADLQSLDPMGSTANIIKMHGFMVYDTLFGLDEKFEPRPQMVETWTQSPDKLTWRFVLRPGMKFHDGAPVTAEDAVASIRRWGQRDAAGQLMMRMTRELVATDDRSFELRLTEPYGLVLECFAKAVSNVLFVMPRRIAETSAFTAITDPTGSGPFRFVRGEWDPGAKVVYEKFADYVPRAEPASAFAGGKVVHFDRVEWHIIPDVSAVGNALVQGEIDWWGAPNADLRPVLARARGVKMFTMVPTGTIATMRFNQMQAPFDNPAIRRAIVHAVTQSDYMIAIQGDDKSTWREGVGYFCPDTPMASQAGMENLTSKRDLDAVKKELADAGYKGEKVVLLAPQDIPSTKAIAEVTFDLFKKIGLNVEAQAMDWATLVQRRTKQEPVDQGGWSVFHTSWGGVDQFNPAVHAFLRGNGKAGIMGWPVSPTIEALRAEWLLAPDLAAQKKVCETLQLQAFKDVPYIPLGQVLAQSAHRADLQGVLTGLPAFWSVRRG